MARTRARVTGADDPSGRAWDDAGMTTPTNAGWYEDPEDPDQLRYFDGVVWSSHRTPLKAEQRRPPAEQAPAPSPAPAQDGWNRPPSAGSPAPPPAGGPAAGRPTTGLGARVTLEDGAVLAEWWRRLLGRAVDWAITSILAGLLSLPFVGPLLDAAETFFARALTDPTPDTAIITNAMLEVAVPVTLVGVAVGLVYEVGFLVWRSATPGKMLLGTRVRPVAAPGRVGVGVALRRQGIPVAADLMALVPLLGILGTFLTVLDPAWLLRDPKRQALHDKVADTVVVLKG